MYLNNFLDTSSAKLFLPRALLFKVTRKFKHTYLRYTPISQLLCDPPRDCLTLHGARFARHSSIGIIQVFSIPTLSSDKRQCEAPYRW